MIINLLLAALAGILIPLALDRFGFDPAVSSTVFVTTVTDVVGFFAFLLARLVLAGLGCDQTAPRAQLFRSRLLF